MKHFIAFFSLLLISAISFAQDGIIAGTVNDAELNDVLPFADVMIANSTKGTSTDFDGKYEIKLEPGTYTVSYSFVGYQRKVVSDVVVKANETTTVNTTLEPASDNLDEVVVRVSSKKNTEQSVLNLQKSSVKVMDGLSIESISKTGADNVASAVKSVPGVSVQGGKFVYVRGLGDRYTKSTLNGVSVPGLDPDKNTLQMDIFPSDMIENVLVSKTATADMPADFTGGAVDISLKDFSAKEQYTLSFGTSYNPHMHFNSDYVEGETHTSDLFGFDNGNRDRPISRDFDIPAAIGDGTNANGTSITDVTRAFNPKLAASRTTSDADVNFNFSAANQYRLKNDDKIGYQAAVALQNKVEYFEGFEQNFFFKPSDRSEYQITPNRTQKGDVGIRNNYFSTLAGVTYKSLRSKYKLNFIHLRNTESKGGLFSSQTFILDDINVVRDNVEYSERALTNLQLSGEHTNEDATWITNWSISPSYSEVNDKDIRVTPFELTSSGPSIRPSTAGSPERIWRFLEESNIESKIDFTRKHNLFSKPSKLKFGAAFTYKSRDFNIDQYLILLRGTNSVPVNGDADQILVDENLWQADNDGGFFIQGNFQPANNYSSTSQVRAAYVSEELKLNDKLKAIVGARFEQYLLNYTGENNQGTIQLDDENVIDDARLYPSANLIYSHNENTNFRGSFSQTTARPSFKEVSVAQIFDPLTNITFVGNIDVKPSYINNFDLRYEKYSDNGNMFAVSGFYKDFTDPIELVSFPERPTNLQPRNVGSAKVFGAEIEFRQQLNFVPVLENFSFNMNVSIIESEVKMDPREYESRQIAARDGQEISDTRNLQGQSPYLVNAGLSYDNNETGWQGGLFYNVQGETLEVVGIRNVPDVYTQPFHNLNFRISKKFGSNQNSKISLGVGNILDDSVRSYYKSYGSENEIFSKRKPRRSYSLSYSLSF
ncbi:MAG: TonB-dependent receptor domain-containing protein [Bacteroidota bacterium]